MQAECKKAALGQKGSGREKKFLKIAFFCLTD
jgi:hypothetical protein